MKKGIKTLMKKVAKIVATGLSAFCIANAATGCDFSSTDAIEILSPTNGGVAEIADEALSAVSENYVSGGSSVIPYARKGDVYAMKDLVLEWRAESSAASYTVSLSQNADLSAAVQYTASAERLRVSDLFTNTTYYWQVSDGTRSSKIASFTTGNTPRTIYVGGVSNTRDIGGKATEDGKRIRQGIVYRGAKLDGITASGKKAFLEKYGIKTDLDLRKTEEATKTVSPAEKSVRYLQYACPYYTGGDTGLDVSSNYANLAAALRVFAEADNYPVYFHCAIGRERTGMLAMLLLGVCGVSREDIELDYELSFLSESGCSDFGNNDAERIIYGKTSEFGNTLRYILQCGATDGEEVSLKDACAAYLLQIGLTQAEIDAIRENLIEA